MKQRLKAQYAAIQEKDEREKRKILQNLAIDFVVKNIASWIRFCKESYIDKNVVQIADLKPEKQYTLYSVDYATFSDRRMPPQKISLTYILVDEYISIIDNIVIDIYKISYSFVNKDTMDCYCTTKEEWNNNEFHYQDIVEIGYKSSSEDTTESGNTGYVFINLVNGTTKEYPASKKYIENLFTDVRARVRKSKLH